MSKSADLVTFIRSANTMLTTELQEEIDAYWESIFDSTKHVWGKVYRIAVANPVNAETYESIKTHFTTVMP